MTRGQDQRVAADAARQLAERDHRAGEGHRADQDAEVGLDVVDGQFDAQVVLEPARVHEVGETHRHRRQAHQAVQDGDQLGHLGHLHPARGPQPDGAAHHQGADQQGVLCGDEAEHRGGQRDRHADDAVPVTPAGRFLVGQPAQREDEQDGRDDVGDGGDAGVADDSGIHDRHLTCGTFRACGGSPRNRRRC